MMDFKSEFMTNAYQRGYVHQCTDDRLLDVELDENRPCTAYIGFDCTADSLHVGSLVPIMLLRLFQKSGHKPIIVLGGGTTKVGDPSGKDETRLILSEDKIAENMFSIQKTFENFLTFGDGPTDAKIINNNDWLSDLSYISFLRDYGRHFSVNRMLSFDSVKLRLEREQPLSFLEFNYMILQAYDFLELFRREQCSIQMGGSDQWGNIVSGIELARKTQSASLFGLTAPLITTASGGKMGKTAKGAIWLNSSRLSPYDYYQFWRNTDDQDVGRFLRLFTELPLAEIEILEEKKDIEINQAKKTLAYEATKLCHGEKAATEAEVTAIATFEKRTTSSNLATVFLPLGLLKEGVPAYAAFVTAKLASTNGEARRLIRGGGARVNDVIVSDETQLIKNSDLTLDGAAKLSAGKKRHVLIRAE